MRYDEFVFDFLQSSKLILNMSLIKKMQDRFGIFGELIAFLWAQKLWWIIPMVIVLVLFAFLLIFAGQTGLAPFVYTLF